MCICGPLPNDPLYVPLYYSAGLKCQLQMVHRIDAPCHTIYRMMPQLRCCSWAMYGLYMRLPVFLCFILTMFCLLYKTYVQVWCTLLWWRLEQPRRNYIRILLLTLKYVYILKKKKIYFHVVQISTTTICTLHGNVPQIIYNYINLSWDH